MIVLSELKVTSFSTHISGVGRVIWTFGRKQSVEILTHQNEAEIGKRLLLSLLLFFILRKSECGQCHWNYCEGWKLWEKRKQCANFTTHPSSSGPYLHITYRPSGFVSPLWAWYYPSAQTEAESLLRGSYVEPLTEWFNPQSGRTIWGSGDPLGTGDWSFISCFLWMRRDILGTHHTPTPWVPLSTAVWLAPTPLDWFPVNT